MKKILMFSLAVFTFCSAFALNVNEKVLQAFNKTFSGATEVSWQEYDTHYTVNFVKDGIRGKVHYALNGEMKQAIRYYEGGKLPLNIQNVLSSTYPKRTIHGVTEICKGTSTSYYIMMYDTKFWYNLKVEPEGSVALVDRFRKA
jgi:hypothetical protein